MRRHHLRKQREYRIQKQKIDACPTCAKVTRLVYDHCHKTGQFRGWICQACNLALGHARDNPNTLLRLVQYLLKV